MKHAARGITLIELLAVVAVVGILGAIAYPSYQAYLVRAARGDAAKLLVTIANRQQQYLLDARAYTATIGPGGLNITSHDGWTCAATCSNARYTVAVTLDAGPPLGFTVTATPQGTQAADGTLALTATGNRSRIVGTEDRGW